MADTVCIAASCVDRKSGRFFAILCSDGRIEIEGVASGEIGHKAVSIAPGVSVMFAGSISKSKELIDRYIKHLNDPKTSRTPSGILNVLREPLEYQQRIDASAYLSALYGMKYAEFLKLDANAQQILMLGLQQWRKDCQLIIIWLGIQFVRLFQVTDSIEETSSFATIGCGATVATTALYARGYKTHHHLEEAVYYVYEAKRVSDSVPGVGKETHLTILEFDATLGKNFIYPLRRQELERLSSQYAQFGTKSFKYPGPDAALSLKFIAGMG